jgi:dTDP-4-dehydrorhamnose reductase
MMRILVVGKNGQVGWELQRTLSTLGECVAVGYPEIDLVNADSIRKVIADASPELIVNAAAYTAVDQAEDEFELAMKINATAQGIMAEEAKRRGAVYITYSTDYVFDGSKKGPWTEEDKPNPLNAYGRTKLAGDEAVAAVGGAYLIFRTSWVYGARGKNFLLSMLKLAKDKSELKIIGDQCGAPTWSRAIAEATTKTITWGAGRKVGDVSGSISEVAGLYNMTNAGETSWAGFAKEIFRIYQAAGNAVPTVTEIPASEYPLKAKRPTNSVMSGAKLKKTFGIEMPDWKQSVAMVMDELGYGGVAPVKTV